jgi:hypothetical protein
MSDNPEPQSEDEDVEDEPIHREFRRDRSGLEHNKDLDLEDLKARFSNAVLINVLKRGIGFIMPAWTRRSKDFSARAGYARIAKKERKKDSSQGRDSVTKEICCEKATHTHKSRSAPLHETALI